ncbi:hypothetical protein LTR78_007626 [Recurvomyces mirabilis]|uniref:Uncharacterized protein n=1 Tax=Recurvomyces mirabilis TaxID=574656 RepID=A0AAE0WJ79_9PEZI|nr:hypothetical protein LTR78_007626 [Recurvomyces mirabilis]KAK5159863.1 hypothetical protein LTS14_001968 [Recurvomyces mirabilis]
MQESITNLVSDVTQLRTRCEDLQNANTELAERMTDLERRCCDEVEQVPHTKANLTGYASSENSTEDPYGDHGSLNDDRFRVVGQLLEQYQQRFEVQEARLIRTERHLEKLTTYKLNSKVLFTALKHELDGLDTTGGREDGPCQLPTPSKDFIVDLDFEREQLQGRFDSLETELLARVITIEARLATGGSSQVGNEDSSKTGNKPPDKLKKDVHKLKNFAKAITRKHEQERLIDNAYTSEEVRGPFEGTTVEVWQSRDRVLCRLAMYGSYYEAFEEAQKAVKEL